jgi:hypothetical protein
LFYRKVAENAEAKQVFLMSMDMHIEYHSIGTPISIPVGGSFTIKQYWAVEAKNLGLEKVVMIGEPGMWTFSAEDYEVVLQLIRELQVLQQHLISLEEDKMAIFYGEERIPRVVVALETAVKNWEGLAWISFG